MTFNVHFKTFLYSFINMRCTEHVVGEFRKLSTSTTYQFLEKSFCDALNYIMKYLSDYN